MIQDIVNFTNQFDHVKISASQDNTCEMSLQNLDTANGTAQTALEELKLLKKFLQNRKAQVREQLKELRQQRRTEQANQMVMPRGGGKWGMFARLGIAVHRQQKRSGFDDLIQPYEQFIKDVDQMVIGVDSASLHIKKAIAQK